MRDLNAVCAPGTGFTGIRPEFIDELLNDPGRSCIDAGFQLLILAEKIAGLLL